MTDESSLQGTNNEIWLHLYTSLHAFLNLHNSQFCPQGEPLVFKSSSYLELIEKVTAPFKPVHICLIKSVDPVVYKLRKKFLPRYVLHRPCYKINFALSLISRVLEKLLFEMFRMAQEVNMNVKEPRNSWKL